jgi:hypothetical protein
MASRVRYMASRVKGAHRGRGRMSLLRPLTAGLTVDAPRNCCIPGASPHGVGPARGCAKQVSRGRPPGRCRPATAGSRPRPRNSSVPHAGHSKGGLAHRRPSSGSARRAGSRRDTSKLVVRIWRRAGRGPIQACGVGTSDTGVSVRVRRPDKFDTRASCSSRGAPVRPLAPRPGPAAQVAKNRFPSNASFFRSRW